MQEDFLQSVFEVYINNTINESILIAEYIKTKNFCDKIWEIRLDGRGTTLWVKITVERIGDRLLVFIALTTLVIALTLQ